MRYKVTTHDQFAIITNQFANHRGWWGGLQSPLGVAIHPPHRITNHPLFSDPCMNLNLDDLPPHIKALNPDLFGRRSPVARLPVTQPQHPPAPALGRPGPGAQAGRQSSGFRVTLTSYRRRPLDRDNLVGGLKPLRDAIARTLGHDDSDEVIEWEYHQLKTSGAPGTAVRIERRQK